MPGIGLGLGLWRSRRGGAAATVPADGLVTWNADQVTWNSDDLEWTNGD
jgi:hypothetical protein